jgi:hypothetical protein
MNQVGTEHRGSEARQFHQAPSDFFSWYTGQMQPGLKKATVQASDGTAARHTDPTTHLAGSSKLGQGEHSTGSQ